MDVSLDLSTVAESLVAARRSGHGFDQYPGGRAELPVSPESIMVRTVVDGMAVGAADGNVITGGVFSSLARTLTILGRRGRAVPVGTFFATGAITGVHPAGADSTAVITFGDLAPLRCRLVA